MSTSSTIQILKVDPVAKVKTRDGNEFDKHTAQVALLNDDGSLQRVGELRISDAMVGKVTEGTFRAAFGLDVAQWGKNKGEVIAVLSGLVPVPAGALGKSRVQPGAGGA